MNCDANVFNPSWAVKQCEPSAEIIILAYNIIIHDQIIITVTKMATKS